MSSKSISQNAEFSSFVEERWRDKNDEKDALVSIAKKQISETKISNQKHPWKPSYDYINGILPIKNFPIKGVIWYQGESNAEHPNLYIKMFAKMVETWRNDWQQNFPFYYVQLTSREDRPAWSEFRNAQRKLLNIVPNTGMVVITDVGDRQDTHAKNKQPVGERLALLALGESYKKEKNYQSPIFNKITVKSNIVTVKFKGAFQQLKTLDNQQVRGFEISIDGENYRPITPIIIKNYVQFTLPNNFNSTFFIRYAWKPFTTANLSSVSGLPVSTFSAKY
jgi:sialate O-acetylesterase